MVIYRDKTSESIVSNNYKALTLDYKTSKQLEDDEGIKIKLEVT